ncbi:MAG: DUF2254 domain-containing protein [Actinomycetes bacterium]
MATTRVKVRSTRRRSRLAVWWWELRYRIGPNLWEIPFAMAIGTIAVFAVTRHFDTRVAGGVTSAPSLLPEWILARNAADVDVVLSAMLSALATTLALVFSISVLTFSMAASQLGPRLIRRFVLDPVTQVTLGAFLASIVMCALTLGSVSTATRDVPEVSYAVAFLMSLGCFFLLIVYVHRVAVTIQSPRVVASVVADLERTITESSRYLPDVVRCADPVLVAAAIDEARRDGGVLVAERSGYLQAVDHLRLLDAAEEQDVVVVLEHRVGQFVVRGQPLVRVLPPERGDRIRRAMHEACEIGDARTREQDVEFALNQVVEIALRALSPAINDSFTGRTCVDWLGESLSRMGAVDDPTGGLLGSRHELRLVEPPLRFERQLRNAYDPIRQAAAGNPVVLLRMFSVLELLATAVLPSNVSAVGAYARVLRESAQAASLVALDVADVEDRHDRVLAAVEARVHGGA